MVRFFEQPYIGDMAVRAPWNAREILASRKPLGRANSLNRRVKSASGRLPYQSKSRRSTDHIRPNPGKRCFVDKPTSHQWELTRAKCGNSLSKTGRIDFHHYS